MAARHVPGRPDSGAPDEDAGAGDAGEADGAEATVEWRYRSGVLVPGHAALAVEAPVALEFNGISHAVMLATPRDLEDFALGFSLSEGIIDRAADFYGVEIRVAKAGYALAIDVATGAFARLKERRRTLAGRTGCGICGTESLDEVLRPMPALATPGWSLAPAALARAAAALGGRQPLQQRTGATHGAAWCTLEGDILLAREDVGRHNALDKLIGALLGVRAPVEAGFALITSRASIEMVQKAASAGIHLLAAVSGPTTLAVQTAERLGVTLVGFVRGSGFAIYSHRERIAVSPAQ